MKTLVALAVLTLLLIGTPAAQDTQPPADQARQRLEQIKDRLSLTPEQIEQVRPIFAEEMQKLKSLRERKGDIASASRRERRKLAREFRDIQSDTDDELKKVLSKAQMKELKKIREEWRAQLRERGRG